MTCFYLLLAKHASLRWMCCLGMCCIQDPKCSFELGWFGDLLAVPRVEDMTLDEKIGQMTQVDKNALVHDSDITKYFIGSVLR